MGFVYILIDPDTFEPYYVGKTNNSAQRHTQHLLHPISKTRELLSQDKTPIFQVLERYSHDTDLDDMESAWINRLNGRGYPLVNERYSETVRFVSDDNNFIVNIAGLCAMSGKPWIPPPPLTDDDPLLQLLGMSAENFCKGRISKKAKKTVTDVFDTPI